jgi:hypothetical protein
MSEAEAKSVRSGATTRGFTGRRNSWRLGPNRMGFNFERGACSAAYLHPLHTHKAARSCELRREVSNATGPQRGVDIEAPTEGIWTMRPSPEVSATAIHEAGHALISHFHGLPIRLLSVDPAACPACDGARMPRGCSLIGVENAPIRAVVDFLVAGQCAVELFAGESDDGAQGDLALARELLLPDAFGSRRALRHAVAFHRLRTRAVLRTHRKAVVTLARELQDTRVLQPGQISAILERFGNRCHTPSPWPSVVGLDARDHTA